MTTPDRPPSGGTHRRSSRARRLSVLLASLVGVAAVAVLVFVVLNVRGEPADRSAPSAASSSSPSPDSFSRQPAASTGTFSTGPATSTSATPTPAGSTPQTAVTSQGGAPAPSLDVLNDSRISGLAHRAAAQFSAAGWDVAVIGNFSRGRDVPATTIFFPDGAQAAAQRLAARFGIDRVLPAPSFLSAAHLSVVLARDWDERR